MATTKAQQKAVTKYVKSKYDRFGLTMPKGNLDKIKAHAETHGESVNGFIGRAIDETMERDAGTPTEATEQPPAATAALLPPDTLEEAQNAARITGEAVPEFVTRAVKAQAKRDETNRRMGLDPVTGGKLGQDSGAE